MSSPTRVLDIWETWQAGSCVTNKLRCYNPVRSHREDTALSIVCPQGLATLNYSLSASNGSKHIGQP